jgi:hypothetical protein
MKPPSEPAQPRMSPVSLNTSFLAPPSFPQQVPEPAPWIFTRRSSGADASHAENMQNLIPPALENESTPVAASYSPFPGHPGPSPSTSSELFAAAGFTDMIPEPSSHAQNDPSAFLNPSSLSGMQVNMATASTPFAGLASSGTHSQLASRALSQQVTPPASPESQQEQERVTGKRRRLSEPKDPRAAKRLRSQRQVDEENLDALYKLLVPSSAGVVQKKDRLGLSTSLLLLSFLGGDDDGCVFLLLVLYHARKWMLTQGGSKQHSTTPGHTRDRRSSSPLP